MNAEGGLGAPISSELKAIAQMIDEHKTRLMNINETMGDIIYRVYGVLPEDKEVNDAPESEVSNGTLEEIKRNLIKLEAEINQTCMHLEMLKQL